MKANNFVGDALSTSYVLTLLGAVGIVAIISAVLIAWPALAYLGSKLF